MMHQNPMQVNVNVLREKVQSKRELYNFLSREGHVFLPKMESTNVYFLKEIIKGTKDVSSSYFMIL
jgi:hypothetical protein